MPLVFGKSLYLHTLFFTVISLKTYRIDMSKILIIDDEVQIRTLLTRMMELEGYDVCQAGDCRAALKQLELQNPDVVLNGALYISYGFGLQFSSLDCQQ